MILTACEPIPVITLPDKQKNIESNRIKLLETKLIDRIGRVAILQVDSTIVLISANGGLVKIK